jgi:hypothetical protein
VGAVQITQLFDETRTANRLVFRHNTVLNGRRVALLAKGSRALIEHNLVEGTGGGAVELWNAPYEGLCAHDYVIRHNVWTDVNQLDRTAAPLWIIAFANGAEADYCHTNVQVYNNTISSGPGPVFLVSQVANLTITNNTVTRCQGDASPLVQQTDASNVVVHGNQVTTSTAPELCIK